MDLMKFYCTWLTWFQTQKLSPTVKDEKSVWSCWLFIWAEPEALLSLAIFPIFKLFSIYKHIIAMRKYLQVLYDILNWFFHERITWNLNVCL